MALLPAICAQEVLGHVFSRHIRGDGPGGPGAGMPGSRLAGVARRPGSRQDTPAKPAGMAIGGGLRPRRRAHPSRGDLLTSSRGCSAPGQRWVSFPGDGRLLRIRVRRGGASGLGAAGATDHVGCRRLGGLLRPWMQHLLRPAHGIGYEAPDVILREGGAVHARGGQPRRTACRAAPRPGRPAACTRLGPGRHCGLHSGRPLAGGQAGALPYPGQR